MAVQVARQRLKLLLDRFSFAAPVLEDVSFPFQELDAFDTKWLSSDHDCNSVCYDDKAFSTQHVRMELLLQYANRIPANCGKATKVTSAKTTVNNDENKVYTGAAMVRSAGHSDGKKMDRKKKVGRKISSVAKKKRGKTTATKLKQQKAKSGATSTSSRTVSDDIINDIISMLQAVDAVQCVVAGGPCNVIERRCSEVSSISPAQVKSKGFSEKSALKQSDKSDTETKNKLGKQIGALPSAGLLDSNRFATIKPIQQEDVSTDAAVEVEDALSHKKLDLKSDKGEVELSKKKKPKTGVNSRRSPVKAAAGQIAMAKLKVEKARRHGKPSSSPIKKLESSGSAAMNEAERHRIAKLISEKIGKTNSNNTLKINRHQIKQASPRSPERRSVLELAKMPTTSSAGDTKPAADVISLKQLATSVTGGASANLFQNLFKGMSFRAVRKPSMESVLSTWEPTVDLGADAILDKLLPKCSGVTVPKSAQAFFNPKSREHIFVKNVLFDNNHRISFSRAVQKTFSEKRFNYDVITIYSWQSSKDYDLCQPQHVKATKVCTQRMDLNFNQSNEEPRFLRRNSCKLFSVPSTYKDGHKMVRDPKWSTIDRTQYRDRYNAYAPWYERYELRLSEVGNCEDRQIAMNNILHFLLYRANSTFGDFHTTFSNLMHRQLPPRPTFMFDNVFASHFIWCRNQRRISATNDFVYQEPLYLTDHKFEMTQDMLDVSKHHCWFRSGKEFDPPWEREEGERKRRHSGSPSRDAKRRKVASSYRTGDERLDGLDLSYYNGQASSNISSRNGWPFVPQGTYTDSGFSKFSPDTGGSGSLGTSLALKQFLVYDKLVSLI